MKTIEISDDNYDALDDMLGPDCETIDDVIFGLLKLVSIQAMQLTERKAVTAAWKKLAEGRGLLLEAYRVGRQPPERAFKLIDSARKVLGEEMKP